MNPFKKIMYIHFHIFKLRRWVSCNDNGKTKRRKITKGHDISYVKFPFKNTRSLELTLSLRW